MRDIIDAVFKLGLLVILGLFLFFYQQRADIGRFSYFKEGDLEYVVDSKTGLIYQEGYSINHVTGQQGSPKK